MASHMGVSARATWADLSDAQLLAQCAVDTYRASGPGGQKRNKTSSAVRIRHLPSGLIVIAEESRSQHENRARALRRIRQALYLRIRDELGPEALAPDGIAGRREVQEARDREGRLSMGRKDVRFWPLAGLVLDVLQAHQGRVSEAARSLGVSTGNLVDFLKTEDKVWEQANLLRARFGYKLLRND